MATTGDNTVSDSQLRRRGSRGRSSEVVNGDGASVPPPEDGAEIAPEPNADANNAEVVQPLYKRIWNYQPNPDAAWLKVCEQTGVPGVVEIAKPDRHITIR